MASSLHLLLLFTTLVLFATSPNPIHGSRKLSSLYNPPPPLLTYHHGQLLQGNIPISILWYGHFTPTHKSILSDFILSLTPHHYPPPPPPPPTVSHWWTTVDDYLHIAGKSKTHVSISSHTSDISCSLGKTLTRQHISILASMARPAIGGIAVVLTSADVAVEGFCMSSCGLHGSDARARSAYVWVGDPTEQCPGQCAWPFHQAVYGPRGGGVLVSPNGEVGADGMVISLAAMLAGAVTNPFGGGFFERRTAAEVAAACVGVYGRGAYPGYAGEVRVDGRTGGSYNVEGVGGRKYLVPAMFDPYSKSCLTMV